MRLASSLGRRNNANNAMAPIETQQVTLPSALVEALLADAQRMRLDLPAYLAYLRNCRDHAHDEAFRKAAEFAFANYPETLRKLSQ